MLRTVKHLACLVDQNGWTFKAIPKIVSIGSIVEGVGAIDWRATHMPANHIGLIGLGVVAILAISAASI
jgi:hypothetical protein